MAITIVDCYTDEAAGLGVPPYIGVYPRYIYGWLKKNNENEEINYITIDDLRMHILYEDRLKDKQKTDLKVYNLTKNYPRIKEVLANTKEMYIILGVHVPGKYLSALPGTIDEVDKLLTKFKFKKVLTGPVFYGNATQGGEFFEKVNINHFDSIEKSDFSYNDIAKYSITGTEVMKQIDDLRIIEIETARGCLRNKGCSFCTEPIKHRFESRDMNEIVKEIGTFYELGARDFRIGKQSCFYSYPDSIKLLKTIRKKFDGLRTLHIDNVNPALVVTEKGEKITKAIVENCTPGNVAAFGVESFDPIVIKGNNLNSDPEISYEAIKIINHHGKEIGENGMQRFLPGINLIFGLNLENRKTHEENMSWLKKILDENLLLRRINIRQVNIFEGTELYNTVKNKFLKKNKKYYWKWRNEIRQKIDFPMLEKLIPVGKILKNIRMEVHDGNNTFGRQLGSYPLIVGVKKKLELKKFYDIKVTGHMLRSIVGEVL